ncbi:HUWE1-associated protein modifying stress responses-like isoform X2 [Artemia franciscana]|uniref:HUWE1-associated protein modifying stress responses-like isoform X2 n=1 Tax=Artemia franciscana TaxID=6661 RepID=UPI0032DA624A
MMSENIDDNNQNNFLPCFSSLGIGGDEGWLSSYERQCVEGIEAEDYDEEFKIESERNSQELWNVFQESAMAVAQLYKDRCQGAVLWMPFQNAAETVTALYKVSNDSVRISMDKGIQVGYQRRNKEIAQWAKRKRRNIKRDELLSFLAGKPPPPPHSSSRIHRSKNSPTQSREALESGVESFASARWTAPSDTNLQTSKEALSLATVSGSPVSGCHRHNL